MKAIVLDLNFTAKQTERIIAVLESWLIKEEIDYKECEYRLAKLKVQEDDIDWIMDMMNVEGLTDVEARLTTLIEEQITWD